LRILFSILLFLDHIYSRNYYFQICLPQELIFKGRYLIKILFHFILKVFFSYWIFVGVITLLVTATVSSFGGYWALTVVRVGFAPRLINVSATICYESLAQTLSHRCFAARWPLMDVVGVALWSSSVLIKGYQSLKLPENQKAIPRTFRFEQHCQKGNMCFFSVYRT